MRLSNLAIVFAAGTVLAQSPVKVTGQLRADSGEPLIGEVTLIEGTEDVVLSTMTTDSQGRFTFDARPGERRVLVAKADGFLSDEKEWTGGQTAGEFSLRPAGRVSGRVVDESGAPVPGARLSVQYTAKPRTLRYGDEGVDIEADEFGHFSLPFVARGARFVIEARRDDRLPAASDEIQLTTKALDGVVVVLPRRGELVRGKLRDSVGRPVAGATVRLRQMDNQTTTRFAVTDEEGSFEFAGVAEGRVMIVAGRPGGRAVKSETVVSQGRAASVHLLLQ